MGCGRTHRNLAARIDGELSPRAAAAFDRHAAACADCARLVRGAERIAAALRALPRPTAPDEIWERLRPEIARAKADAGLRRLPSLWPAEGFPALPRTLPWGVGAAAAAAAIALLARLESGERPGARPAARKGPALEFVFRGGAGAQSPAAEDPFVKALLEGLHPGRAVAPLRTGAKRS